MSGAPIENIESSNRTAYAHREYPLYAMSLFGIVFAAVVLTVLLPPSKASAVPRGPPFPPGPAIWGFAKDGAHVEINKT
ncbi:hypothetical protein PsYK624_015460 [Phanerochaete sordida]|uniref:Uncharacterized protein n=1 Tax=Phanerochaete sordida TaxID=48140 RepID=A0A9P3L986_9APHY|nr:hypothetical protein PsYK624_015460 [Phanerochaete sordida]